MKIKRGISGGLYIVFENSYKAQKWSWLLSDIMGFPISCFGQYENAYEIYDGV